uniref:Sperm associated antigen 8 n=1 Tax=Hucho hucho TaxID=62062 RepID=A0A4W5QW51_9TELE
MTALDASVEQKSIGKGLLYNWVEERATAVLDNERPRAHIHKNGHKGILTMDLSSKVQGVTTVNAAFTPPKGHGVRQRGIRGELLENDLLKKISEQTHAEFNPEPPKTEFYSTTKEDYKVEGFQPSLPSPLKEHDYKSDQAITFWSENHHQIQGVTAVRTRDTPFKKNATFSTPISEHMDDTPILYTPEN